MVVETDLSDIYAGEEPQPPVQDKIVEQEPRVNDQHTLPPLVTFLTIDI